MEERYHATTQNRFYPNMSNVNKNITVEAKLIRQPTYLHVRLPWNLTVVPTDEIVSAYFKTDRICTELVTLTPLTWRIWRAPNNASR